MMLRNLILAAILFPCLVPGPVIAGPESRSSDAVAEKRVEAVLRELNIELVAVRGGTYQMGDLPEFGNWDGLPVHEVTVGDFLIGKTEVTQAQWEALMGSNPSRFKGANNPVEQVSWNDSQEFLRRLSEKAGATFRLPTEAEWEYAARSGGRVEKWAGAASEAELAAIAWFQENSGEQTHPVGMKSPNGLGLQDMTGNVWEWCSDWYADEYYALSPKDNPQGPEPTERRVLRGGAYTEDGLYLRTATRFSMQPHKSFDRLGFRLAASLDYIRSHQK